MEQYIDETPWDGLRFGALNPAAEGGLFGVAWNNHHYDVQIGPKHTVIKRDGVVRFEADAGVVIRRYKTDLTGITFMVKTLQRCHVTTRESPSRTLSLAIDKRPARALTVRNGGVTFTLDPGEHHIAATWKAGS
jgi:hypothetical protein